MLSRLTTVFRKPRCRFGSRMPELVSTAVATACTGRSRTSLRYGEQFSAADKQIHQRTGNEQPVRVLLQPAIAYFHESELQLHHLKHVLHPRPHFRLRPVLRPRHFIHDLALVATAPLGEIPCSWRALADHLGLPLIRSVAPHPRFFAMQQVRQHGHIGNMGGRRHRRVDDLGLAVDAHVRFHPEVPILPLLRLVHLWVPALLAVFGRGRGVNQGRVHNRARRDSHTFSLQMQVHRPQNLFSQIVLFQQVPELTHRSLVRHRLGSQINSHELAQGRRVIQRLFHRRICQVEPLLQKINPQHLFQFFRPSSVARLGIVRLDQRTQLRPRHHLLHLFQEHCPPRLLRVPLESCHHRQCPLLAESVHAGTTLSILPVEREDLIRVSLEGAQLRHVTGGPCTYGYYAASVSHDTVTHYCALP